MNSGLEMIGGHPRIWWMQKFGVCVSHPEPRDPEMMLVEIYRGNGEKIKHLYSASEAVATIWEKFQEIVAQAEERDEALRREDDREDAE